MKKLTAKIGLKLVNFGLFIYKVNSDKELDEVDKIYLKKLKDYERQFLATIKGG